MTFDPALIAEIAKLVGSLVAVLLLGWIAKWMGLGGEIRIRDEDHAKQLAFEGQNSFIGVDAVVDLGGYSALVRDADGRHVVIALLGNHFVTRMIRPPIEGRLNQKLLTIELQDPDFEPVTLNLGEQAQFWASGLRHIPAYA
jgi:hypothetical protein